jgi:hypothetical protein
VAVNRGGAHLSKAMKGHLASRAGFHVYSTGLPN